MIEIHLYGKLRSLVPESNVCEDTVMMLDFLANETFAQFVQRLGLERHDLGDCFINGKLAKNDYVLVSGSIPGTRKRLIRFIPSIRPKSKLQIIPEIISINK